MVASGHFAMLWLSAGAGGEPRLGETSRAGRNLKDFDERESFRWRDRLVPNIADAGSIFGPRLVLLAQGPDSSAARIHPAYLCATNRRGADSTNAVARRRRRP